MAHQLKRNILTKSRAYLKHVLLAFAFTLTLTWLVWTTVQVSCADYVDCREGQPFQMSCGHGAVFDDVLGCVHPDQTNRFSNYHGNNPDQTTALNSYINRTEMSLVLRFFIFWGIFLCVICLKKVQNKKILGRPIFLRWAVFLVGMGRRLSSPGKMASFSQMFQNLTCLPTLD